MILLFIVLYRDLNRKLNSGCWSEDSNNRPFEYSKIFNSRCWSKKLTYKESHINIKISYIYYSVVRVPSYFYRYYLYKSYKSIERSLKDTNELIEDILT
jgi:hypothetical protein